MFFVHDCDACKYVGSFKFPVVTDAGTIMEPCDTYLCDDTVIMRVGNRPEENRSLPLCYAEAFPGGKVILAAAQAQGLI